MGSLYIEMEEKKMVKERTREDIEWDLEWEKRWKKILLICSAIFCGLGIIIGAVLGITEGGGIEGFLGGFFGGLWVGTGVGGFISYIPNIPHALKRAAREGGGCSNSDGCFESVKDLLIGILIWLVVLSMLGPIGLLVRFLWGKYKIKKFERELSEFGR